MLGHRRRKEGAIPKGSASQAGQPKPHWRKVFSGLGSSSKSTPGKKVPVNEASNDICEGREAGDCQVTPREDAQTAPPRDAVPTPKDVMHKMRPIAELWDEAYQDLALQNMTLIDKYELLLAPGTDFDALDLTQKRAKMKTILEEKIKSIEDDAWKLKFKEHEFAIKDAVEPVVGVIEVRLTELNDYVEGHDVLCFHLISLSLVPLFWYRNLRYARLVGKRLCWTSPRVISLWVVGVERSVSVAACESFLSHILGVWFHYGGFVMAFLAGNLGL
jgi:hypothetical protein